MVLLRFKKLLSRMYYWLPVGVRIFIGPVLEPAYFKVKRILSIVSQLHQSVYQFKERADGVMGPLRP